MDNNVNVTFRFSIVAVTIILWEIFQLFCTDLREERSRLQVLRQENVEYVVAPYEADAQMAFLALNGHVDLIITEDSDLIPYGCPRVNFQLRLLINFVSWNIMHYQFVREGFLQNHSKDLNLCTCFM